MENKAQKQRIETITEELKNTQSKLRQCKKEKLAERFESKRQNEDLLAKLEDTERKLQEARKDEINKVQDFEYNKSISDKEYERKNTKLEMEKLALEARLKHLAEENEGMKKNMSHQEKKLEYEQQKSCENFEVKDCCHQSNEHKQYACKTKYSEDEENRNNEIAGLRSKLADAEATLLKMRKEALEMKYAVKNEKIEADTKYGHELSRIQQSKIDLERRVEKLMKENETQRETHEKNAVEAASKLENMERNSQKVRDELDESRTRYSEDDVNMKTEIARLRSKLATFLLTKNEAIEMKNSVKNEKFDGETEYRNELFTVQQSKIDLERLVETLLNENEKQRQTYEENSTKTAAKLETMERSGKKLRDELDETKTRLLKMSKDKVHKNREIAELRTRLVDAEKTFQEPIKNDKQNMKALQRSSKDMDVPKKRVQSTETKLMASKTKFSEEEVNTKSEIAGLRCQLADVLATLQQTKQRGEERIHALQNEKSDTDAKFNEELTRVQQKKKHLEKHVGTLSKENEKLKTYINRQKHTFEKKSMKTDSMFDNMERNCQKSKDELNETSTRLQKISKDNEHQKDENKQLRTLLANVEQTLQQTSKDAKENKKDFDTERSNLAMENNKELSKFQQKINILKRQIEDLYTENDGLKNHYKQNEKHFSKDMNILKQRLQRTEMELSDARNKLGKCMQQKQVNSYPNIADLSDIHRPRRLADRFQELYDDRWTDAFETLEESNKGEKDIIHILLTIVTETKHFCDRESEQQMEDIKKLITQSDEVRQQGIPDNVMKYIKDCKKASFPETSDKVYKKYQRWLQSDSVAFPKCVVELEDYTK